ncbi:hypothetical protein [Haladaptatus caseinilyticus]|uniref:hypothetical protein n=1 Tax=Haladaptatus caseinilyticus TaxID=2993314 RepID=UPI00224AC26D|nr:hypothetical protein [Haladaptatus caseinilyticus]
MDESALRSQMYRIRRRQYLILILLIAPIFRLIAELIGFWTAGVLCTVLGLVSFATFVFRRR